MTGSGSEMARAGIKASFGNDSSQTEFHFWAGLVILTCIQRNVKRCMSKASLKESCFFVLAIILLAGCGGNETPTVSSAEDTFTQARLDLVEDDIKGAGIMNEDVLRAMREAPRHEFVPPEYLGQAYENHPLPIGYGQTISQPYIVAWMTELLELQPGEKVLEVGTGSEIGRAHV